LPASWRGPGLDGALTRLLDALIEVVRADKGFVLEVTQGAARILKARNFSARTWRTRGGGLSDTIVKRVLETASRCGSRTRSTTRSSTPAQRGQPQARLGAACPW
jgi:hypothetical protein